MAKKLNITIVGDGGWGTAIGMNLLNSGHSVTIWGPFKDYLIEVKSNGENSRYLPGVKIPEKMKWEDDPEVAVKHAEIVVLAVPSHFYETVCRKFSGLIPPAADVISISKGFCQSTRKRLTETAKDILGIENVAALSGPSHAEEVSRNMPTAVVIASSDQEQAYRLQSVFSGPAFRVYVSSDPVGVELGGAIKNVIALAAGISDGLGYGDNSRAALITRGLAEMARLGSVCGGSPDTFAGLSGIGDLVVTCTSRHSRNRGVGERLGRGEKLDDIVDSMKQVAEGVWNCGIVLELARANNIEMPICETVQAVLEGTLDPRGAFVMLMSRDSKPEKYGV